jgi:arylsulfatase A-like enzyme
VAERPNILLVVLGGARGDRLSCHGHGRETTPFLDEVGREGVRFTNAFANSTSTLSAHASLFTGLFTTTHGASAEQPALNAALPVLPEILRRAGYRTAAFCAEPAVAPATGFGRGFAAFSTPAGDGRSIARAASYARRATDRILRRSDTGARRANLALFDWLGAADDPFFAFLHYGEASLRRQPPMPFERLFLSPATRRADLRAVERDWHRNLSPTAGVAAERTILDGVYDGALRYVDARLAEVAAHLAGRGLWERTLLVVTADHGTDLREHEMPAPGLGLFDTQIRIPLLLRWPARLPQGFAVEEIAQQVDVLPSVLDLVGLGEETPAVQGRVLVRDGRVTAGPAFAIAELFRPDLEALGQGGAVVDARRCDVRQRALRTRREKYVWRSDEDNAFHDLAADPGERRNLVREEPGRARAARSLLFDWLASVDGAVPAQGAPADEAVRQQA